MISISDAHQFETALIDRLRQILLEVDETSPGWIDATFISVDPVGSFPGTYLRIRFASTRWALNGRFEWQTPIWPPPYPGEFDKGVADRLRLGPESLCFYLSATLQEGINGGSFDEALLEDMEYQLVV